MSHHGRKLASRIKNFFPCSAQLKLKLIMLINIRYVSWYKYLIVSLVFSHLGFWSGNLFLIAPFPDLCLLVPFYTIIEAKTKAAISCAVTEQLIGFFVLAYYEKFWVSLGTAEIDVNENNVFFDGFDPYGLEIICFIFSVFVKNNDKFINTSRKSLDLEIKGP